MKMTRTFWFSFISVISLWVLFVVSIKLLENNIAQHQYKIAVTEVQESILNGVDNIRYEVEKKRKLSGDLPEKDNEDEEVDLIESVDQTNPIINIDPITKHKDFTGDAMLWAFEEMGVMGSEYYCAFIKNDKGELIYNQFKNYFFVDNDSQFPNFKVYQHINNNPLDEEYVPDYCLITEQSLFKNGVVGLGIDFSQQYEMLISVRHLATLSIVISGFFALVIGFYLGRNTSKKLTPINSLCEGVQQGDLNTRIPIIAVKDEFDRLAVNVNLMLDQLAQHVQSVRHISDNIAHDLRTPVTRLRGQLDLLLRMDKKDDTLIEGIIDESDLLISIFNALLRIAQLESDSFEENFKPMNIDSVLLDAVDLYEPMFEEKNIKVKTDIQDELIINGDSDLWIQAFSNILDNALKYSESHGEVKIAASKNNRGINVVIHDCGKGIPRTEQDRVFQRFYRLSKHRASQGSGLGLSLVAAVCRQHKASIDLSNNCGLVVKLSIPFK